MSSPKTRLDVTVQARLSDLSRASAAKLIEQGKVKVNGEPNLKAGYRLRVGDKVKIDYNPVDSRKIPKISLPILYEDDDCVAINKPIGVLTHSKGEFNPEATVATWLSGRVKSLSGERAGIVHRLDRATSGVMICAKNPASQSWLQKQFAQRRVRKTYLAIVAGQPEPAEAVIDMPIERNPKAPATFRVGPDGKPAITHYKLLRPGKEYSLVELKPTTGRTHQLRVHLAKIGHPIVGDKFYGGPSADRLFLHAWKLELTLPNRQRKTFMARRPRGFLDKI